MSTESELREWRTGSTQAERLAAALLALDGHRDITPQAPLGGADDRKDILSSRDDVTYLSAVYFPSTVKSFSDVTDKFQHDREGMQRHGTDRFIFLTNQHLTLGERSQLRGVGSSSDEIYDLQRITTILDSPPGYGLRLSHLRIQMTIEEQISFFEVLQGQATLNRNATSGKAGSGPPLHETTDAEHALALDLINLIKGPFIREAWNQFELRNPTLTKRARQPWPWDSMPLWIWIYLRSNGPELLAAVRDGYQSEILSLLNRQQAGILRELHLLREGPSGYVLTDIGMYITAAAVTD